MLFLMCNSNASRSDICSADYKTIRRNHLRHREVLKFVSLTEVCRFFVSVNYTYYFHSKPSTEKKNYSAVTKVVASFSSNKKYTHPVLSITLSSRHLQAVSRDSEVPGQKGTTQQILYFPQNVLLSSVIINQHHTKVPLRPFEVGSGHCSVLNMAIRECKVESVSCVINLQVSLPPEHPWLMSGLSIPMIQEDPVSTFSYIHV